MKKPFYAWNYLLEAYWLCESRLQEATIESRKKVLIKM